MPTCVGRVPPHFAPHLGQERFKGKGDVATLYLFFYMFAILVLLLATTLH
jgi:hypothetical protein